MKPFFVALFALSIATAAGCDTPPADVPTATATEPPAAIAIAPAPAPGDALLAMAHRCARELFPDNKGVSGQALRFDAMALSPYGSRFVSDGPMYELPEPTSAVWHVRIEEEHPHRQIPNGAEFVIHPNRGTCARAPMD